MNEFRLDRYAFRIHHIKDASDYLYWGSKPITERLKAANYLNGIAYDFPEDNLPKMDRNYFKIRKRK
jgi:hypothetical protein